MAKYTQIYDGEWGQVKMKDRVACCDCGLVHDEEYKLEPAPDGSQVILIKCTRNRKATAARRRRLGIENVKPTRRSGKR